ncbi:methylated-DNA--[protein]-cysteine S-methyltransferase [Cellvibrio sp. UBA7671]|uniref:methylated-DNA--[protein]-cysteine S-methyltransferase n=1 Tax=Cellvibrio sp. UBA7671 TaxID=1946312 RepID=UPI002F358A4A
MSATTTNTFADPRWPLLGDVGADGQFMYAVITTGVYCRPGCPSRRPNPDNVRFFDNHTQAEAAGFRACKRCHPQHLGSDALQTQRITNLCRFIESAAQEPSLANLAEYAGISSYHLQRLFKAATGLTPKAYAKAHRHQQETQRNLLIPRKQSAMTLYFALETCSLGAVLIAQSEKGICAILLGDDPQLLHADLQRRFPTAELIPGDSTFLKTVIQVIRAIEQPQLKIDLPLDIRGTVFQQKVWQSLQKIPAGETRSYTEIAEEIGSPNAVRAVAGACAANAIAIIIPCHRVVRSDGNLSGYRWGVERKQKLLQQEAEEGKS